MKAVLYALVIGTLVSGAAAFLMSRNAIAGASYAATGGATEMRTVAAR